MPSSGPPENRSTLALLQAAAVFSAIAGMAVAFWLWHANTPWLAWSVVVLVLIGHASVLALECAMAAWINRHNRLLRGTWSEWLHAWWNESRVAPIVFGWRQPFHWRRWPDTDRASPGTPGAVVLIHGFVCNRGFWLPWMQALQLRGLPYVSVNLEPVFGTIDEYVASIEDAVLRAESLTSAPPTLVCHSMGGLAARAWLASHQGNAARIRRMITIGTPHHGTWLARLSHFDNARQMRPDGDWLMDLAERERRCGPARDALAVVCWYSNTDNVVFPAETAILPGADNRLVRAAGHVDLAFHATVMTESLAMLASASSSPKERTAA